MNSTLRAVTVVGSSALDGMRSVGSELVILLGRKVLTVGLRPGVKVEGEVGLADEAVETWNLAWNRKNLESVAHLVRELSSRSKFSMKIRSGSGTR